MYSRLAPNYLKMNFSPTLPGQELQACATVPDLCGTGDWTQGLLYARQGLCQLSYIPSPGLNLPAYS